MFFLEICFLRLCVDVMIYGIVYTIWPSYYLSCEPFKVWLIENGMIYYLIMMSTKNRFQPPRPFLVCILLHVKCRNFREWIADMLVSRLSRKLRWSSTACWHAVMFIIYQRILANESDENIRLDVKVWTRVSRLYS